MSHWKINILLTILSVISACVYAIAAIMYADQFELIEYSILSFGWLIMSALWMKRALRELR